jgi:pyruvate/2-oxoglutarate/acetoin dehydrogenase E1 component
MALSQKNMKSFCTPSRELIIEYDEAIIYKYLPNEGEAKIAVVSFGVNISIAKEISEELSKKQYSVSLINIITLAKINLSSRLFSEMTQYDKMVVLDSGKSETHFSTDLVLKLKEYGKDINFYQRDSSQKWSVVSEDAIEFDVQSIVQKILKGN